MPPTIIFLHMANAIDDFKLVGTSTEPSTGTQPLKLNHTTPPPQGKYVYTYVYVYDTYLTRVSEQQPSTFDLGSVTCRYG